VKEEIKDQTKEEVIESANDKVEGRVRERA
jgi:hypothetical protein